MNNSRSQFLDSTIKGVHYRNWFVYKLITYAKLGFKYNLRFKIASEYIKEGESVLDVCSAFGELGKFLPKGCSYCCLDMSSEFLSFLSSKEVKFISTNLHNGLNLENLKADVLVMIISLYQFRNTSAHVLLEKFKEVAGKVVIVEDVLERKRRKNSFVQKLINYLSSREYYFPTELFTVDEFEQLMRQHQYTCKKQTNRYMVGYYLAD